MDYPDWLWIPVTIWAAFAQTLRNATQRGLSPDDLAEPFARVTQLADRLA